MEPRPLEFVSPTSAEQLRKCGLALAFRRDQRYVRAERPGPGSALGSSAHAVIERVAAGELDETPTDDLRARLEVIWSGEVERQAAAFLVVEALTPPPAAEEWPNYFLVRSRVLRRAVEAATRRRALKGSSAPGSSTTVTVERELRAADGRVRGRPDRIESGGSGTTVVDLKTGALEDEVRPEHRRQLLFYAALVEQYEGAWPSRAAIEGVDGRRRFIDIDPVQATAVVNEALGLLGAFNQAIESGAVESLAMPSPDSCRFCAFAGGCLSFLNAVDPAWNIPGVAFAGRVNSASSSNSVGVLSVNNELGVVDGAGSLRLLGVPDELMPEVGEWASVVRAAATAGDHDFRARWETQLWVWEGPAGDPS